MARETKFALIAGLAFIVCFAAILTRRGQTPRVHGALTEHPRPDLGTVAGGSVKDQATRLASGAVDALKRGVPAMASGASDLATQAGSLISGGLEPSGRTAVEPQPAARPSPSAETSARDKLQQLLDEKIQGGRGAKSDQDPAAPASKVASADPSSRTGPETSDARVVLARHTVSRGDTLMKIARAHYGTDWKRGMDSILAANSDLIRHPDELRTGVDIELPRLPQAKTNPPPAVPAGSKASDPAVAKDASTKTAGASAPPAAAPRPGAKAKSPAGGPAGSKAAAPVKAPPPKGARYELKPGDTYMSVARVVLGDPRRWKEIHDLNKDRFPTPADARAGETIRLPDRTRPSRDDST